MHHPLKQNDHRRIAAEISRLRGRSKVREPSQGQHDPYHYFSPPRVESTRGQPRPCIYDSSHRARRLHAVYISIHSVCSNSRLFAVSSLHMFSSSDPRLNVHGIFLPNHILSRHIPAASQIGIPESLHSFSPSIRFFRAPMVAPSHALTAVKMNPGTVFSTPVAGRSRRQGDTPQAHSSTVPLGKRQRSKNEDNTVAAKKAKKNNKENSTAGGHFGRSRKCLY